MANSKQPRVLEGLGVSPGVAIGRAVCIESEAFEIYRISLAEESVDTEVDRLRQAAERALEDLSTTRGRAEVELGSELAAIFDAQALLLSDAALLTPVENRIRTERVNAEWAVHKEAEELTKQFEGLDDERFRTRSDDLRDVIRHLIRALQGVAHHDLAQVGETVIIVAHDITPSEAVRLVRQQVVAFALETGGQTSHTAIIARDLNIPLVAGLTGVTGLVTDDDPVVIDGSAGRVILHPSADQLVEYEERRRAIAELQDQMLATQELPSVTLDGVAVDLMANVDLTEEVRDAERFGASGVGLYRSEFLYIERSPSLPSEDDHFAIYRQLLDAVDPHPVVIRTYDLGGRKLARDVMETEEENPVLGLRGIRLTLARPQIFRTQLRALFRAGVDRNLWILLPMISTLDEVNQFKSFAKKIQDEMRRDGIQFNPDCKVGVMIEVPSAALIADLLATEVDFFSIGTNDLIQYSLAVDRNNEHVSYLYRPLHPAILRMLRFVLNSASSAGIDVSMCGEMASDPLYTPLLLGMGLRRLSVTSRAIPEVKAQIRQLTMSDLESVADRCLRFSTAAEVESYLGDYLRDLRLAEKAAT
ncbi:MAG: phosphoenolpyruvate--protein phosphotransferase [Acidobacteriota bacterium]